MPQIQMKWRPSATAQNQRTFMGISSLATAVANPATGTKGIYFSNCTAPTTPTCGATWSGIVSDGATVPNSATSTNAVACPSTDKQGSSAQTTNFMYGRIEFRKAPATTVVEIEFFIDYDVSNGIQETSCGTVTSIGSSGGLNSIAMSMFQMSVSGAISLTTNLDVDYFRVWQDDAPTDPSATDTTNTTSDNSTIATITAPPISPDSPDPNIAGSFFNFMGNTADDTVFNHNVFIHGTLYADKIKANQIEGLEVFTDTLASLQQKLAQSSSTSTNPTSTTTNNTILQTATTTLNLNDGLTVGGDANFHGNVFFYKLVTFMEKTVFNNDVSFAAHVTTDGQVPGYNLEAAAGDNAASASIDGNDNAGQLSVNIGDNAASGELLSVNFAKPYAKAPRILLTASNGAAAQLKYYVTSTPNGFKVIVTDVPASGTTLILNYWVVQ
jgi:hypothetical protein